MQLDRMFGWTWRTAPLVAAVAGPTAGARAWPGRPDGAGGSGLPWAAQAWLWAHVTRVRAALDAQRWQHADATRRGCQPLSLLASGRLERRLAQRERWLLGPWARSA